MRPAVILVATLWFMAGCQNPALDDPDSNNDITPESAELDDEKRIPYAVSRPIFDEVLRLQEQGKHADAKAALLSLVSDPVELWIATSPDHEVGKYFSGGRQYVTMLIREGRPDDASVYLDDVAKMYARWVDDYDYELARAEVLQAQGEWGQANGIYDRLWSDFPLTGYGTMGYWFHMWNNEIHLGKAEVLVGRGKYDSARRLLRDLDDLDLEKLRPRWDAAVSRAERS